jgi:putative membrane protein
VFFEALINKTGLKMKIITNLLISTVAVVIGSYLIPGIQVEGFMVAIIVAFIIGLFNAFLKPILVILTIPATFFTLGLFLFVIDAVIILLAGQLINGFVVEGFWPALFFSMVIGLISWLLTDKKSTG